MAEQKNEQDQMAGFKRMGVMGDWEHPYKTMNKGFEADEVRVFGKMYQNGHIYKAVSYTHLDVYKRQF